MTVERQKNIRHNIFCRISQQQYGNEFHSASFISERRPLKTGPISDKRIKEPDLKKDKRNSY